MVNYSWRNSLLILFVQGSSKRFGSHTCSGVWESIPSSHLFYLVKQVSRTWKHTLHILHHIPLVQHVFQYCIKANCFPDIYSSMHASTRFSKPMPKSAPDLKEGVGLIRIGPLDVISAPWLCWPSICTLRMSCANLGVSYRVRQASFYLALSRTAVPGAEPCLPIREPTARSMGLDRKPGWLILWTPKCRRKQYSDVREENPSPQTHLSWGCAGTSFAVFSSGPPPQTPPTWPQMPTCISTAHPDIILQ